MAESHVVPRQDQGDTTRMNLHNDVTINGQKFRKGQGVEVPKAMADNIAEIDYNAQEARMNLVRQPKEYVAPMGQDVQI